MKTIQEFLEENASYSQKQLFFALEEKIRKFSNFPIIAHSTQISFKGGSRNRNFAVARFEGSTGLQISFNCDRDNFTDPCSMLQNMTFSRRGANSRLTFSRIEDLDYVLSLIKQSYEKNRF
ncbi:DUF5655 domain-containing protein [Helicobacter kayseriensis]|uniref:DUF5655 domain-containing protein n=1 Tax=Helicobacter kayseriensis TaxID=2905877 RepID=UPI001E2EF34C|nr:DUF5655 domain-containing protein [Helicobacter kayseriensis]MCE3047489.1 DUF5655 domain-containing protein [Helicobacter kayseriensis]MCE3048778.1 DUF5655 domain-containing protein [Helicobacter kayseriensis]